MSGRERDLELGTRLDDLAVTVDGLVEELALDAARREAEEKEARRAAFQEEKRREMEAAEDEEEEGPTLNQGLMFVAALVFGVLFIVGWTVVYNKVLDLEQVNRDEAMMAKLTPMQILAQGVANVQLLAFSDVSTESNLQYIGGMVANGEAHDMSKTFTAFAGDAFFLTTTSASSAVRGSAINNALAAMAAGNGSRIVATPGMNDLKLASSPAELEALFAVSAKTATAASTGSLAWVLSNIKKTSDGMALDSTSDFVVVTADGIRFGVVGLVSNPNVAALAWEDPAVAITRIADAHAADYDILVAVTHQTSADNAKLTSVSSSTPTKLPAHVVVQGNSFAYGYSAANGKAVLSTSGGNNYLSGLDMTIRREAPSMFTGMPVPYAAVAPAPALAGVESALAAGATAFTDHLAATAGSTDAALDFANAGSMETNVGRLVADRLAAAAPAAPAGTTKVAIVHAGLFTGTTDVPSGSFFLSALPLSADERFVTVTTTQADLNAKLSALYSPWAVPTANMIHVDATLDGTTINSATGAVSTPVTGTIMLVVPHSFATTLGYSSTSAASTSTIATVVYNYVTATTTISPPATARVTIS